MKKSNKKDIIKKRIAERHKNLIYIRDDLNAKVTKRRNLMNERDLKRIHGNVISLNRRKKINVIISAYDCVDFIERCLDSVSAQTYKSHKILLGIDGCTKTLLKVLEIRNKYTNLDVYYAENNTGPYQVFNSLIELVPDDEYIQIFGADDIMNPDMLEKMSRYEVPVVSRNDGVLFIKKDEIKKVGGFRDWRCAADSDMLFRIKLNMGATVKREPIHFIRGVHDKQLTKMEGTDSNSELRKNYIMIFEENKKSENPDIYISPVCNPIIKIN